MWTILWKSTDNKNNMIQSVEDPKVEEPKKDMPQAEKPAKADDENKK